MSVLNQFTAGNFKSVALASLLIGSVGLTSCLEDNNIPEIPDAGYISIYDGATGSPGVIIYADSNRVNDFPLNYTQVLPYKNFFPGDRTFKFSETNSLSSILEKKFTIKVDSVYSMFMIKDDLAVDAILVDDDWEEPVPSEAQVRLVNISYDAGAVSVVIEGQDTPLFQGTKFKENTDFAKISKKIYDLYVLSDESKDTLVKAMGVQMNGNRVYTLVLRGIKGSKEQEKKLDLQLLTNYINY
jgi:hypothetical protein